MPLALSADQTEASATETAFGKMANVLILWVLKFLNKRFIASVCRIILFILSRHIIAYCLCLFLPKSHEVKVID